MTKKFNEILKQYVDFLKEKKLYKKDLEIEYEHNIEKLHNWKSQNEMVQLNTWFEKIKKNHPAIIKFQRLDQLKDWVHDKKKGIIHHKSKKFFKIIGIRTAKSGREVNNWDQPFIMQVGYKGGIIGLVRKKISGVPHYLVQAKFEPGNYGKIQLSPSLQATYSNLQRAHEGEANFINTKFFKKNFKTLKKYWVNEDGGRLYKKRNLHYIINTEINDYQIPGNNFRWMTLWQIREFLKKKNCVSPHLRSILTLI
jgi:dTDP-4-dehydro-6-deoxy-alpha-D-glucopyranose 2,3-dehydratase